MAEWRPIAEPEMMDCPQCGGRGFGIRTGEQCCQQAEYECGGKGCIGPCPVEEQVPCDVCQTTGEVPSPPGATDDER